MGQFHFDYEGKLVAICDVDRRHIDKAKSMVGDDVRTYEDFRELLDQQDIDVVHIATPPHWHGIMAIEAAKAGKDIWRKFLLDLLMLIVIPFFLMDANITLTYM